MCAFGTTTGCFAFSCCCAMRLESWKMRLGTNAFDGKKKGLQIHRLFFSFSISDLFCPLQLFRLKGGSCLEPVVRCKPWDLNNSYRSTRKQQNKKMHDVFRAMSGQPKRGRAGLHVNKKTNFTRGKTKTQRYHSRLVFEKVDKAGREPFLPPARFF